jgi:acetyl-CoA C-acetyltransferase
MAGIASSGDRFQAVEVYDAFAGAQLQALEALGLHGSRPFQQALDDGWFSGKGPLVVNPSGGLIGQGAAPGATGIAQVLFLTRLMTGQQTCSSSGVDNPDRTLVDTHGGVGTVCFTHILEGE